jgi:hypothetical protein
MKARVRTVLTAILASAVLFCCMSLFAQVSPTARVPVGPPGAPGNHFSLPAGPLPAARQALPPSISFSVHIGQSYDGVDFLGSNCVCFPPDASAAVDTNFVVETVNTQVRVITKLDGSVQLDESLSDLLGVALLGVPRVVYDDIASRWYITAIDSSSTGILLAVSNDSNPIDGFQTYDLPSLGFPDFPQLGYNKDAIFISYNDFGVANAPATIAAIDKAAILGGTLAYYVSVSNYQFRALPPAQMHGDNTGGVEWFVSTDGTFLGGTTMRVTRMTDYLSTAPVFTYTSLPVTPYQYATTADQPGGAGTITTDPNTTTSQVHYRNGHLVTAMSSATATDGFIYPKGLYYVINAEGGTPVLLKQGVIDPGPGVAVQMMTVDEDRNRRLGFSWIESSIDEYLSMWVGGSTKRGRANVAPGGGYFYFGDRLGDYGSTVIDPADGLTFWSANETIGADGDTNVWKTHITSFTNSN